MTVIQEKNAPEAGQGNGSAYDITQDKYNPSVQKLCSGYGQYHSPDSVNPRPLTTVTLTDVEQMMVDPPCVEKAHGQWMIPSTSLSRSHSAQRENGEFWALWADVDESQGLTFAEFASLAREVIDGKLLTYTSRSATRSNQKTRLIVPTAYPLSGFEFVVWQKILNDKLKSQGIEPDRVTERAGQLCYLPNRGEFYDYAIKGGGLFNPDECWSDELATEMLRQQREKADLKERREVAKINARARVSSGTHSPIDAFNAAYDLPMMFDTYGYLPKGRNRWLSPNSSSNSPAVSLTDNNQKWLSAHGSDSEIGQPCPSGNGNMGDAFDLFVHYEHNGDKSAALKAAGEMFIVNGVSLNQANRDNYREAQRLSEVAPQTPVNLPAFDDRFSLNSFSLNGMAAEMESKMLDDKFILGRMAIFGQSTVLYAKPNAGKTLLTLWLLIEAIKTGVIDGSDVFYINADDNYKGLTYKLKLAERYAFHMLAPGYKDFKAEMLSLYLNDLIAQDTASGKILILDTVKKFTDIMRKDKSSNFGEVVRQFVAHGGSVVMLAHVNKHRDDEGRVVYSGTTDLVDDADCAYTLDMVTEDKLTGERTVKFENFKSRGDVALEAVYSYDFSEGVNYYDRLESVKEVSDDERQAAEKRKRQQEQLERNQEAVDAIKECIRQGVTKKTELIKAAHEQSGVSRSKINRALKDHTGKSVEDNQFWHVDVEMNNANVYKLNWGVG